MNLFLIPKFVRGMILIISVCLIGLSIIATTIHHDELAAIIWICGTASVVGSLAVMVSIEELSRQLLERDNDTETQ